MVASLVTETHPNTFPRLPVREGATVFVWFSCFPDREKLRKICRSYCRSNAAKRTTQQTSRAHERTTRGAAAFADCSIAPLNTGCAARIALLLNLQKKSLKPSKPHSSHNENIGRAVSVGTESG